MYKQHIDNLMNKMSNKSSTTEYYENQINNIRKRYLHNNNMR